MRSTKMLTGFCLLALVFGGLVQPSDAFAQRHRPRGRGHVVVAGGYRYYPPYYWSGYYGSPFWGPYGYWWPPYYAANGAYDYASDLRIMATPREAEVYVDGFLVGTVDDFDGWSQRLRIQPGEHDVELYLEGYRSLRQRMLFRPGETYKIRATLEKLAAGDEPPARPAPAPGSATAARQPAPGPAPDGGYPPPRASRAADGFGTLAIRVQPADAVVSVDGERWDRPDGDPRLSIELSAGTHRVEVRKEGHKPFVTTATVRAGEVTSLNVSLPVEP